METVLAYITVIALMNVLVRNILNRLRSLTEFGKEADGVYSKLIFGITPRKTFCKFYGILIIRTVIEVVLCVLCICLISGFILKLSETLQTIIKTIPTPLEFCKTLYIILIYFITTSIGKQILDWQIFITENYITHENLMPQKI